MLLLKLFTLVVLLLILIQDLRSRSVYWILFPILGLFCLLLHFFTDRSFTVVSRETLVNWCFLLLQFLVISAYFSVKNGRWVNITADYLGWGDLLLLLSIAFYLPAMTFIIFYVTSLLVVLISWMLWQMIIPKRNKHIPLAGLQALLFACLLTIGWWLWPINLINDDWMLRLMNL